MKKLKALQTEYAPRVAAILKQDRAAARALGLDPDTETPDDILFKKFAAATDPTATRTDGRAWKFLPWICRQYLTHAAVDMPIRAEDFYKLKKDLADFESRTTIFARNGQPSQIENIHSYTALLNQLRPYQQERDARAEASRMRRMDAEQHRRIMAETTVIYNGPEGKILVPHTKAASQHWGAQTRWCISATESQNYFDSHDAAYAIVMYLPRPTAAERAAWPYKSFKFAGVEKRLYDELDRSRNNGVPPCLKKLAAAALRTLDPASAANLRTHGVIDQIENATDEIPAAPTASEPENPEWEGEMGRILRYFGDNSAETMDSFPNWRDNRDFHLYTLKRHYSSLFSRLPAGHPFLDDEELALLAIKENSDTMVKLSPRLRDDRAFVLRALATSAYVFSKLSYEMRTDREIVKRAVTGYGSNISYVPPENRYGESFLRTIFRRHVAPLFSSTPNLRDDFEIACIAARDFSGFKELSHRLRRNHDLFALSGYYDLGETRGGMRNDPEICLKAIEHNNYNCPRVGRRLRADHEWLLRAVAVQPGIIADAPRAIINDRDFIKEIVAVNGKAYPYLRINKFASLEYPYDNDREIAYIALTQNGRVYENISGNLRADPELAMLGARAGVSPTYMPSPLDKDPSLWLAAVTAAPEIITDARDHDIRTNKTIVRAAAAQSPNILERIRGYNRTHRYDHIYDPSHDIGFMRECVMRDARFFPMTPFALREDRDFMATLIRHYDETGRMAELGLHMRHYKALWGGDITHFTVAEKALAKLNSTQMPAKDNIRWLADRQGYTL